MTDEARARRRAKERERYQRNKAAINARHLARYYEKKEEISAKNKATYPMRREEHLAQQKEYRDRTKEQKKVYYAANRTHIKEQRSQYWRERIKTPEGWARSKWGGLNSRTVNGSHPRWSCPKHRRYLERGTKLLFTWEEFLAFVVANWTCVEMLWQQKEVPSIDRLNSDGDYSLDNIQIISVRENCRRSALDSHLKSAQRKMRELAHPNL